MSSDCNSCRTRPTEYLAEARSIGAAEYSTEPDLELSHIFASRDAAGSRGRSSPGKLDDAASPHNRSDASSIPVDPTTDPELDGASPRERELSDESFHLNFSPILATAAELGAELELCDSVGILGIRHRDSPPRFRHAAHAAAHGGLNSTYVTSPLSAMLAAQVIFSLF
ncbi:hypothetical protein T492DRAFT_210819 [Pavlovales sp. CCMP2436]|nr:hypothetical protein T492DRAFT_210819 [Pavlovales sp. CCMP2436]